jgi:hypothetical protein
LKRIALAIFAKTLGVSSVKTRLANEIGVQLAEEFYALSVAAIKEVATVTHRMSEGEIVPHWALAEEQSVDNPQWLSSVSLVSIKSAKVSTSPCNSRRSALIPQCLIAPRSWSRVLL